MMKLGVQPVKQVIYLTLGGVVRSIAGAGHLLCDAAEVRGRIMSSTYLVAMGLDPAPHDPASPFRRGR